MSERLNLLSFKDNIRTLHLTWFAFFLSFVVWFNHAPLMVSIRETLQLTDQQVKALLILNVALTIPARIVIGILVDRFCPRRIYSLLLAISGAVVLLSIALLILTFTARQYGRPEDDIREEARKPDLPGH